MSKKVSGKPGAVQSFEGCGLHRHVFDVETFGLNGPENLLNDPAPTVELSDPSCLFECFDPMAGQQAPTCRLHTYWRVDFSRLNDVDGRAGGNALFNRSVFGVRQGNASETNANPGRALLLPGSRGQLDRMFLLRRALKAEKELACIIGKIAIMGRSDQDVHAFWAACKHLEDVPFTVGYNRDIRSRVQNGGTSLHAFKPAIALFFTKRSIFGRLLAAARAFNELHVNRSEQRALFGLHRDRSMADNAVFRPIITKARCVLNRQNMQTVNAPGRDLPGLFDNLFHCHLLVPQKPTKANLTCAIAADATHRNTTRTDLDKTTMQKAFSLIQTTITKMRTRVLHLYPLETARQEIEPI